MNASRTRAGFAWRMSSGTGGQALAVEVQEEGDDRQRDDDREDRPRLAQPLGQRDRGDLGRLVLEGFEEGRRVVVVRDRRVERGCGLHRTRPYRTGPLVDPLPSVLMVLSVRAVLLAHAGPSRVAALATGLDAAVAADPVDALRDRGPEPDEVGRPPGDDLGSSRAPRGGRPASTDRRRGRCRRRRSP